MNSDLEFGDCSETEVGGGGGKVEGKPVVVERKGCGDGAGAGGRE